MNPWKMSRRTALAAVMIVSFSGACSNDSGPAGETADAEPAPTAEAEQPAQSKPWPEPSHPVAVETTVLGPFTGFDAELHPDNAKPEPVHYYGTDLGWSYEHDGKIHFLFGDTHRNEAGEGITAAQDDSFGSIDLADWPDATGIAPGRVPKIRMGQKPGTAELQPIDTGQPMEGLKTPNGAFSNGEREFGMFITGKPTACQTETDCPAGLSCDTTLGYVGARPDIDPGLTLACAKNWPGCNPASVVDAEGNPIADSGLCADRGSSMASDSEFGHVAAAAMELLIGIRSEEDPGRYENIHTWSTNRFINVASRTVADFVPNRSADAANQDYRNVRGAGGNQRVFLWGRPWFNGVNAKSQNNGVYFAYVDMPSGPDFEWDVNYYVGSDEDGTPRFSTNETDAAALDLDSTESGVQPVEVHDFVQHMSVVWIESLGKWIMFYGGGISMVPREIPGLDQCGVAQIFVRTECESVDLGNGALRMRTADQPWGPWTPPQDLIVAGDPESAKPGEQYGPGGVLYHPSCEGKDCQARSVQMADNDYGWFYGANIIEEWTTSTDDGVDVYWLASTWAPYRVIMLKTRIRG
jgi:hypothetical protein